MSAELFVDPMSQPARSVLALLELTGELGGVQVRSVSLAAGELRRPEFQALNPNMKVPCYRDADVLLFESGAILKYLCNRLLPADNPFFPRDQPARAARVDSFLQLYHSSVRPAARLMYGKFIAPMLGLEKLFDPEQDLRQALAVCSLLDSLLAGKLFLVFDQPTIADLLIFQETIQLFMVDSFELDKAVYPNLRPYLIRMLKLLGPASMTMAPFVEVIKDTSIIKELLS